MTATVEAVERAIFDRFPAEWAESWDRVGLLAGDPGATASRVLVTLDATRESVRRAAAAGASVLVTHHPVALSPFERLLPGAEPAGVVFEAVSAGVALIAAHTNLDRSPEGVRALPRLLGLSPAEPIERSGQPMARVTCFAPPETADAIVAAMAGAGAGRVGEYEGCSFRSLGVGEFVPRARARPHTGSAGTHSHVDEMRIEMVCSRSRLGDVLSAARGAHPYEEPLIVTDEVEIARGAAALGMRCTVSEGITVSELALLAEERLGAPPRVWGDPDRRVRSVATATGSASSLLGQVLRSGAEALVCGEVRYHDALSAAGAGLAIIECGHDVSEWPLVPVLAEAVRSAPGIEDTSVIVEGPSPAWWTV